MLVAGQLSERPDRMCEQAAIVAILVKPGAASRAVRPIPITMFKQEVADRFAENLRRCRRRSGGLSVSPCELVEGMAWQPGQLLARRV